MTEKQEIYSKRILVGMAEALKFIHARIEEGEADNIEKFKNKLLGVAAYMQKEADEIEITIE